MTSPIPTLPDPGAGADRRWPAPCWVQALIRGALWRRRAATVALLLAGIAILWLALQPVQPRGVSLGWDKLNHGVAFFTLALLAAAATRRPMAPRSQSLIAAGLMAYGGVIELLQTQVPGRSGEWPDLLADAAGLALGLLLWWGLERWTGLRQART